MGLEEKIGVVEKSGKHLKKFDVFLLKYSKVVDNVDMFLGPFSEVAKFSDSDLIKSLGFASAIIKGAIKIPFVSCYLARTRDFSALYDWVPKEIFSYAVPMGSFIDILRNYEKITYAYYGLKPFEPVSFKEYKQKLI